MYQAMATVLSLRGLKLRNRCVLVFDQDFSNSVCYAHYASAADSEPLLSSGRVENLAQPLSAPAQICLEWSITRWQHQVAANQS